MDNYKKIKETHSVVDEEVETYIRSLLETKNPLLKSLEVYANINNVPIIEPDVAKLVSIITKIKQPKKILEIGTAIGYSTINMKNAAPNAKITTIELCEDSYFEAKKNIEKAGYSKDIRCILGDADDVLNIIYDKFDMIFIDAAKGQYLNYFKKSKDLINENGIILSDNVLFRGMVAYDKYVEHRHRKITIVKRLRNFLKYITNLEGYSTSIIPIDDGLAITYKEG